jgi:hypothetical protein
VDGWASHPVRTLVADLLLPVLAAAGLVVLAFAVVGG